MCIRDSTYTDIVYIGTLLHFDALLANVAKNPSYKSVRYLSAYLTESDEFPELLHYCNVMYETLPFILKGVYDLRIDKDVRRLAAFPLGIDGEARSTSPVSYTHLNESWLSNSRVQLVFCKTIQYNFFLKTDGRNNL